MLFSHIAESSPEIFIQKKTPYKSFIIQNLILSKTYFTLAASLT
jgi:hypothetical protein